ncbi:phosphatase PAP2 family protein [Kitasatospora sp. NPDC058048]|uniref:phosphatase PAP2 family protein n=1 Tax=Kitasatospora sp. NPDC058048 TaxID=3346313 RepID=UPI0036DECFC4
MTQQDRPSLSTIRPDAPGRAPGPSRTIRPFLTSGAPALLFLLGFTAVYLIAVATQFGQLAENSLIKGYADSAWVFQWTGPSDGWGPPLLVHNSAMPTLAAGTVLIAAVALVRRCWWHGCAAISVVVATVGGTEAFRAVLPRPDLTGATEGLTGTSFPSGHVAIAAGLTLGAVLVASPRVRPYVAAAGMLWLAFTAAAVQALYWHRPSDALGATLLACACYSLAARLLPPSAAAGPKRRPRALPATALALSAAGALAASAREDSATRPLAFATAALLCSALVWIAVADRGQRRAA